MGNKITALARLLAYLADSPDELHAFEQNPGAFLNRFDIVSPNDEERESSSGEDPRGEWLIFSTEELGLCRDPDKIVIAPRHALYQKIAPPSPPGQPSINLIEWGVSGFIDLSSSKCNLRIILSGNNSVVYAMMADDVSVNTMDNTMSIETPVKCLRRHESGFGDGKVSLIAWEYLKERPVYVLYFKEPAAQRKS